MNASPQSRASRFRSRLSILCFMTAALVSPALLSGCGNKEESQKGPDGKPHFNQGPGLSAADLAKANAYRQQSKMAR